MELQKSELVLNADGSIYHLHLKPEQLARTILTVGDSDRVEAVTRHFDSIEHSVQNREFKTQTGWYNGRRLTVISTGIGTDNIDIVLNELDALANIDLETRQIKETHTRLDFIRIGTSGAVVPEIPIDSFLISQAALGFDGLPYFYAVDKDIFETELAAAFATHTDWPRNRPTPYAVSADAALLQKFASDKAPTGLTATNIGFYGPQGRVLRLPLSHPDYLQQLGSFQYQGLQLTNMEMETAGIYCLAKMLGHRALSLNALLANRATGAFSGNPQKTIDELILYVLERI